MNKKGMKTEPLFILKTKHKVLKETKLESSDCFLKTNQDKI